METILVIEDDKDINDMLSRLLSLNGYAVKKAFSGTEGVLVHGEDVRLVLLDLMLPGKNGEEIIEELKAKHDVPVIVVSAVADIEKKIDLFKLGANDYVTKPFNNDELLARIKVWIKSANQTSSTVLRFKDIELNKANFTAECNGKQLSLTKKEFEILKLLMENEKQTLTKSMIFESVWDYDGGADDNTLNVHISKLKNKLKECNKEEEYIETVWSIGYRLKIK